MRNRALFPLALLLGLSAAFCAAVILFCTARCEAEFFHRMESVAAALEQRSPGAADTVMEALGSEDPGLRRQGRGLLQRYGYDGRLLRPDDRAALWLGGGACALLLFAVMAALLWRRAGRLAARVDDLTLRLRRVNEGEYALCPAQREDILSPLEDELYKTVVALRESREAARRGKERLAQNLADISHQLKTPLASLTLLGEALLARPQDREGREAAARIVSQAERLSGLAASLLTLSRLDAGALCLRRREEELSELLDCAACPVRPLMERRGQTLNINGAQGVQLMCDLGWTAEAIGNLLKNASEHAPQGGAIDVCCVQNPVFTQVTVEDSGEGFAPEDLPHLFERFYRGRGAARDSVGIGLALARAIAEGQGGELRAENRREGGARFILKFYRAWRE